MLARGDIGKVEEAEVHRLLDLVGVRAGEDYPGYMGLDDTKTLGGVRVQGRILQGGDQCLAHGHSLLKFLNGGVRVHCEAVHTVEKSQALWPLCVALQTAERPSVRCSKVRIMRRHD
jgi:hypothetical protein